MKEEQTVSTDNSGEMLRPVEIQQDWRADANCRDEDPNLFFPGRGEDNSPAKAICRECIVAKPCLDEALEKNERFGIRGGTSERERRRIRKNRNLAGRGLVDL